MPRGDSQVKVSAAWALLGSNIELPAVAATTAPDAVTCKKVLRLIPEGVVMRCMSDFFIVPPFPRPT